MRALFVRTVQEVKKSSAHLQKRANVHGKSEVDLINNLSEPLYPSHTEVKKSSIHLQKQANIHGRGANPTNNSRQSFSPLSLMWLGGVGTVLAGGLYYSYLNNTKVPIIDRSVLKTNKGRTDLLVVGAHELEAAGHKSCVGRSSAHKVQRDNPVTKDIDYYYFKETFDRASLIKELVFGALGRELDKNFPQVLLCETPRNDKDDSSSYALLSQSVGGSKPYSNLEAWAYDLFDDYEFAKYAPKHLGRSLAYAMLLGKTDIKLANFVGIWDENGICYPIDNESALKASAVCITDADEALEFIGEFANKRFMDHAHEQNCDTLNVKDDIDRPIKSREDVKKLIRPVLLAAIQRDIDNGQIEAFYKSFVALSDETIKKTVSQFGLLTDKEQVALTSHIQEMRQTANNFLSKNKQAHVVEENKSTWWRRP